MEVTVLEQQQLTAPYSPTSTREEASDNNAPPQKKKRLKERRWKDQWIATYPWVYAKPVDGEVKMFCSICQSHGVEHPKNQFRNGGSVNFQASALAIHARSALHLEALGAKKLHEESLHFTHTKPQLNDLRPQPADCKAVSLQISTSREELIILLKTAYHAAKKGKSFQDYDDTCELLSELEVLHMPSLARDSFCSQFSWEDSIILIGDYLRKQQYQRIGSSGFYGLTIEDGTDFCAEQQMVLYICYVDKHRPVTEFLKLARIQSTCVDEIFKSLTGVVSDWDLNISKLVGLSTDGAACMRGAGNENVVGKLKTLSNGFTEVHCLAHRTASAASDAGDEVPEFTVVDKIIKRVHDALAQSSEKTPALRAIQLELKTALLSVLGIHKARWSSQGEAMKSFVKNLPAILVFLYMHENKKFHKVLGFGNLFALHFLADILYYVSKLDNFLSSENLELPDISPFIDSMVEAIKGIYDGNVATLGAESPQLQKFLEGVHTTNGHYAGFFLPGYSTMECQRWMGLASKYASALASSLSQRFPDSKLFASCRLFSPRHYHPVVKERYAAGKCWLEALVHKYGSIVNGSNCFVELPMFMGVLNGSCSGLGMSAAFTLFSRSEELNSQFPSLFELWKVVMCIPCNNACCRRGVSRQTSMRSDDQTRLASPVLDSLLTISMNGPSTVDIQWDDVLSTWYSKQGALT